VVPTTGPSNSKAETGASVSISILDGTNVLTPISSFFGFASLDNTGSVTLSNDFAVAGVVNESDAGSTSDEHRKQLNYSGVLEATVDATSSLQVKSSTFCISNLASDGFTAPTLSYSCFDQNTFNLEISSTDPNVRFELVNVSSVPEPSAFFCLATIGAGLWIGRVTIVTWFRRPATSI
ncbi:MAG: hypothetical protein KDB27_32055, partial [Planctomycetales bacterium]|nr:hypothetical protein [Planctomycetales bacterium]